MESAHAATVPITTPLCPEHRNVDIISYVNSLRFTCMFCRRLREWVGTSQGISCAHCTNRLNPDFIYKLATLKCNYCGDNEFIQVQRQCTLFCEQCFFYLCFVCACKHPLCPSQHGFTCQTQRNLSNCPSLRNQLINEQCVQCTHDESCAALLWCPFFTKPDCMYMWQFLRKKLIISLNKE